jgi:hypothetical protein
MADEWKSEKEHVIRRMDRFDARFDKLDEIVRKQGDQIDALRVDILTFVSENRLDFNVFKKESQIKNSAWAFLGTAIALAAYVLFQFVKSQLV